MMSQAGGSRLGRSHRWWSRLLAVLMLCLPWVTMTSCAQAEMYSTGTFGDGRVGSGGMSSPQEISGLGLYLDSQSGVTQAAGATDFDGVNDKLVSANTTELSGDTSFEICGWVKVDTVGDKAVMAKSNAGAANAKSWMLRAVSGGLGNQLQFTISSNGTDDGGYSATSATAYSAVGVGNAWHFVRIWHDATSDQIGIQVDNGTKSTTSFTAGVFASNQPIILGARLNNGSDYGYLDGQLDSVAVVNNGRLSDADAAHLYNGGLGRNWSEIQKSTRLSLSHFYNLNGGSGTFIDLVGTLDLAPSGSPGAEGSSPVAGCVSAWADQSNNAYGFTPTAAERRPDVVRDFGNGNTPTTPAVGFWRSSLQGDTASRTMLNNIPGGTFFIVYKPVFSSAGENTIFYYQAGNGLRRFNYSIVPNPSSPGDRRWLGVTLDSDGGGYIQKLAGFYTDDKHTFEAARIDYSQAKGSLWSDGEKLIDEASIGGMSAGNTSNTNSTGVWLGGNGNSNPGQFTVAALVFYPRKLTDAEIDQLEDWAYQRYYHNANTDYVVLAGDSNMAQTANPTGQRVQNYLDSSMAALPWPKPYFIENMGLGGLKMSNLQTHLETNYRLSRRYFVNARNVFLVVQGGTNDKIQEGADSATIVSRLRSVADFYRYFGFKPMIATPVPLESGATPNTEDSTIKALRDDLLSNGTNNYGFMAVPNSYDAVTQWSDFDPAEVGTGNQYIHLYPNTDPNNGVKKQANAYYNSLRSYLGL